jgi:hypothetical protein
VSACCGAAREPFDCRAHVRRVRRTTRLDLFSDQIHEMSRRTMKRVPLAAKATA